MKTTPTASLICKVLLLGSLTLTIAEHAMGAQGTGNFVFSFQTGSTVPPSQYGNVCASSTSASFTVTSQVFSGGVNWISVTHSGTTTVCPDLTSNITVTVNPGNLGPGTYSGEISVTVTGADNNPLTLPVTLTVTCGSPILRLASGPLSFNYVLGSTLPGQQSFQLTSDCGPVSFTASSNESWLSNSPSTGTTPTTINVEVDPAKTIPGTSQGQITISAPGSVGSPLTVYADLNTTGYAGLTSTSFSIPAQGIPQQGLSLGPDGAIWFTSASSDIIGRITTQGNVTTFPLVPGSDPDAITTGPDGALWFGEDGRLSGNGSVSQTAKIGRITTGGIVTEYTIPGAETTIISSIVAGPDSAVWFCASITSGAIVGRVSVDGQITEFPVDYVPDTIVVGPDGNLWFTSYFGSYYGYSIGRITTAGTVTWYPIPTADSGPAGITLGPDNALWFTEVLGHKIGRITIDGAVTEYALPPEFAQPAVPGAPALISGPYEIVLGADGSMWFYQGGLLGRITTGGVMTFYNIGASELLLPIIVGPDGALWAGPSPDVSNQLLRISGPRVTNVNPVSMVAGSPSFTLTVNGSGFDSSAAVSWNEIVLSTAFVDATQLTAIIPSSLLSIEGTAHITVSVNGLISNNMNFVVTTAAPQTIFFPAAAAQTVGTPLTLIASASSGLPVSYSSSTTNICTISGSTASFIATGSCTITASQEGNSGYAPAAPVSQTFLVVSSSQFLLSQTITFNTIASQTVGIPLTLTASASSGLPISYSSSNIADCTISGSTASFVSAGICTITASQAGNSSYQAAASVSQTFHVSVSGSLPALQFVPVAPCRLVDTRNLNGPFGGSGMAANTTRSFNLPEGPCGVPPTALAYSLNITAVPAAKLGYLTIWPAGQSQPPVSTLNSDGRVKANAAIVPAGANGGVSVYVSDQTHVILDINGYFVPAGTASSLSFYPLTPCRIADTRNPGGPLGGPLMAGGSARTFPILSSDCNVPSTAQAYSLNLTAIPRKPIGYLSIWPTEQSQPLVSALNASTGAVTANAAIVPAGANGSVDVYTSDNTDLVIDINGYFGPPATGGLALYTVTPCRALDTRNSSPSVVLLDGMLAVDVTTSSCPISATAQAIVFNATVVPAGYLGFLALWPHGIGMPLVSTLNAEDGAVTSNMAIVPTADGSVDVFSPSATHVILDVSSYFAPQTRFE